MEVAKFCRYARSYEIACDESHKICDFYRVLYGAFRGCSVHHLGDAIESLNRAALSLERGLSLIRGRPLDDPEMKIC